MNIKTNWDKRFLDLAEHISNWSKDPATKVGAVLVGPDRSQISLGYNGFPRGVLDAPERYLNKEDKCCRIVHAELNAILNSQIKPVGHTLYVTPLPPCAECAKAIIQSGIKRVVVRTAKDIWPKWLDSWSVGANMFSQVGITFTLCEKT